MTEEEPKPLSHEEFVAILQQRELQASFMGWLGATIYPGEPGHASVRLEVDARHIQPEGVVHGGVIFSLADTACAIALHTLVRLERKLATIEAKINMLAPITEGTLVAEGHVSHRGKNIAVIEAQVYNEVGEQPRRRVALMVATFMILNK